MTWRSLISPNRESYWLYDQMTVPWLTSRRWNDLVDELWLGALPQFFNDYLELLVLLINGT